MGQTTGIHQVVVIGAGPAGIAAATALEEVGARALVLDRASDVVAAWRARYDRLRLNTCRPFSHLPGRAFPKGTPMFPTRDQVVEYFEGHARELDLELGIEVKHLEPDDAGWALATSRGPIQTRQVIVATGYQNVPVVPEWAGKDEFQGQLLHACQYRNPEPFRGQRVLVVGPGCSGMEIAYDLAEGGAAKVWLSVRTPPNIMLRAGPGGLPGDMIGTALLRLPLRVSDAVGRFGRRMDIGDLDQYGLPVPEEGPFTRLRRIGMAPSLVDKEVIEAIRGGQIEIVRGVKSLDSKGATLLDGVHLAPEAIVFATGYRPGLEPLVGHLGVLDARGMPKALGEQSAAPGLRFVGYVSRPGALGYMGKEARRAAKVIARELAKHPGPPVAAEQNRVAA